MQRWAVIEEVIVCFVKKLKDCGSRSWQCGYVANFIINIIKVNANANANVNIKIKVKCQSDANGYVNVIANAVVDAIVDAHVDAHVAFSVDVADDDMDFNLKLNIIFEMNILPSTWHWCMLSEMILGARYALI